MRKSGSQWTRRWREVDSNSRSRPSHRNRIAPCGGGRRRGLYHLRGWRAESYGWGADFLTPIRIGTGCALLYRPLLAAKPQNRAARPNRRALSRSPQLSLTHYVYDRRRASAPPHNARCRARSAAPTKNSTYRLDWVWLAEEKARQSAQFAHPVLADGRKAGPQHQHHGRKTQVAPL
jgi:hypothetical protein